MVRPFHERHRNSNILATIRISVRVRKCRIIGKNVCDVTLCAPVLTRRQSIPHGKTRN